MDQWDGGEIFISAHSTIKKAQEAAQRTYNPEGFKKYGVLAWEPEPPLHREHCLRGFGNGSTFLIRIITIKP